MPASRGRPAKWKHQPTKQVRIPTIFEAQILEFAMGLDADEANDDVGTTFTEAELKEAIASVLRRIPPQRRAAQARIFNQLLSHLKGDS